MEKIKDISAELSGETLNAFDWKKPFSELPNWDSMREVNFQLALESTFEVDLSDLDGLGDNNLESLIEVLRAKGAAV